jgi:hypothetical protein
MNTFWYTSTSMILDIHIFFTTGITSRLILLWTVLLKVAYAPTL